jgi:large subunit ribosomal protein L15
MHPIHSRLFKPTPISQLAVEAEQEFDFQLPDPVSRKDLEYYRDIRHRGYLSWQVQPGHTPSLYFRNPGVGRGVKAVDPIAAAAAEAKKAAREQNRLW